MQMIIFKNSFGKTVARPSDKVKGGARGGRGGYNPPVGEKLTICREFVTDDNTFIYCTNYEYLLLK